MIFRHYRQIFSSITFFFWKLHRTLCNISATNVTAKNSSNGKDHQARMMAGRVVTVKFIDDLGQIHLEETGLALIPVVDEFEPIGQEGIKSPLVFGTLM